MAGRRLSIVALALALAAGAAVADEPLDAAAASSAARAAADRINARVNERWRKFEEERGAKNDAFCVSAERAERERFRRVDALMSRRALSPTRGFRRDSRVEESLLPMIAHLMAANRLASRVCVTVVVGWEERAAAYASPSAVLIVVHTPLLGLVENDAQLAGVLAHELAHQALGHHEGPDRPFTEATADHLAVEFAAKAGYDPLGIAAYLANSRQCSLGAPPVPGDTHEHTPRRVETLERLALNARREHPGGAPPRVLARIRALGYPLAPCPLP